jgi:glycosyltransferase involved in cell wall biosynthesis
MKLTLAITTFNRYDLLLESFSQVIDDPRIDEILICDDHSKDEYWNKIKELPSLSPKIKVVRQLENRNMSVNKRDAIFHSKNEWVIIFDSDNVIDKDYLDALEKGSDWAIKVIHCPELAKPHFDFRNIPQVYNIPYLNKRPDFSNPMVSCLFNCCNYVVNREAYLSVWEENKEMIGTDTIWFAYLWLKKGNYFEVTTGMQYFHRVHKDSCFLQDVDYNMKKAQEIQKMISQL